MALITKHGMDRITRRVVKAVRAKAEECEVQEGVVAIGYCNEDGKDCFRGLLKGEDCMRVFSLKMDDAFTESLESEEEDPENFGNALRKVGMAAKVYAKTSGHELTSCHPNIGINDAGCVVFPIVFNFIPFGKIYVSVSGMSKEYNELCAWEAYDSIVESLGICDTSNPGPKYYNKK